jgi:hypothetical protein
MTLSLGNNDKDIEMVDRGADSVVSIFSRIHNCAEKLGGSFIPLTLELRPLCTRSHRVITPKYIIFKYLYLNNYKSYLISYIFIFI